ncbi:MAG: PQQ-binding-like beta-propeller repeat protein [Armatimonadetes bacterium]|nr:PQQ-binding-like beta-propeller repeat protein [Armatimonadota bacterium]
MRIRRVLLISWLVAWWLAASPAVSGEPSYLPEASGLLIPSGDFVTLLDLEAGREVWRAELPEVASGEVVKARPQLWVAAGESRLLAFDPQSGQILWEHELAGARQWGPVLQEETILVGTSEQLTAFRLEGPPPLWTHALTGKPTFLELPRGVAVVSTEESGIFVAAYDRSGERLWSDKLEGILKKGPWLVGERVLLSPEDRLSSLGPEGSWSLELEGQPVGEPRLSSRNQLLVGVRGSEEDEVLSLDPRDGAILWRRTAGGELVSATGADLFTEVDGQLWLQVATAGGGSRSLLLDPSSGRVVAEQALEGRASFWFARRGKFYLLLTRSVDEVKLEPRRGREVLDLKTGKPVMEPVTGFSLVEWQPARGLRAIADEPRSAPVGPIERIGDVLVFATQARPVRTPGQGWKVDPAYPDEPVLLRGFRASDGSTWTLEPEGRAAAPSLQRLPEAWPQSGGLLLTSTEDEHLEAIDPETGQVRWRSEAPYALYLEKPVFVEAGQGRLLMMAQSLAQENAYLFDPAAGGKLVWRQGLAPWFIPGRLNHFLGVSIMAGCIAFFIFAARRRELFLRRLPGLNAVDEAVGRATEMGKPVLYVTGLADVDDIQTLASLSILGYVARKAAEYDTPILVPTARAVVMSTAQEVVKESYTAAGRPDAFQPDNVRYLTDDQFGYTAGVDGMMMRDQPAANFFMGTFYGESLILAETGHAAGAIQIAGTAMPSQLPFFVAACDYTLIGEELYAASAYLSRDPLQVGSLRGQDLGKAILMACLAVGAITVSLGIDFVQRWFET